ncbi:YIP1 family protein [Thalassococcus profundi]|uniref:YIP1 family protein n=1 Tax=Thalassococcus profundi TaxID=2282382 RepID=A0A369TQA4_9RHOB|nr:YIP1 family protein [Thalassococcus profundi]RDD67461.1 YIP1 family protein [Thalassococcus profundi]
MPVTRDIAATYRGPGAVMRRLLAAGPREDRALAILMGACLLVFIAQWPAISRRAHLEELELNALLAGALFGWLFIAPLGLYLLAALSHLVAKLFGGKGGWYGARLALFWSLLASTPLILLNGLVAGFIGKGAALSIIGLAWFGVFLWFWLSSLKVAEQGDRA